jgi:flagellar hook-length control protein FliK
MSIPSLPPAGPSSASSTSSSTSKTASSAGDFHQLVQQHLDRDDRGRTRPTDRREHDAGTTHRDRARAGKTPVGTRTAADGTVSRGADRGLAATGQPVPTTPAATSTPVVVPSNAAPGAEASRGSTGATGSAGSTGSAAQAVGGVAAGASLAGQVGPRSPGTPTAVAGQSSTGVVGVTAMPAGDVAASGTAAAGAAAGAAVDAAGTPAAGQADSAAVAAAAATTTSPAAAGSRSAMTTAAVPETVLPAAAAPTTPLSSTLGTDAATSEPTVQDKKTEATPPVTRDAASANQVPGPTAATAQAGQASQVVPNTPATAANGAGPAASTTSSRVLDQVLPVVPRLVSRGDGTQRLTLKLHPADLGEVHLTVTVKGGSVDVTLAAGHEAREALREGSSQLRSLLQLAGHPTGELVIRDLPTPASAAAGPVAAQTGHLGSSGGDSSPTFTQQGGGRGQQEQGTGRSGAHVPSGRTAVPGEPERPISQVVDGGAAALDVRI